MNAEPKHSPRLSLRFRLTMWFVLIFTIIQWSSGAVFWLYQSASINRLFDEFLAGRATEAARRIEPWLPDVTKERLDELASGEILLFQVDRGYIEVFRPDGSTLSSEHKPVFNARISDVAAAATSALPLVRGSTINPQAFGEEGVPIEGKVAYVGVDAGGRGRFVVALATSDQFVDRKMALVTRALLLTGIIGPIAASIAGWFIGGIAVAPFERLRRLASGLRPESVGRTLEFESSNSEVARLTEELDRARQRMMEGFASQERFLSNVSHEIKTPIAVMLLEAQTLDTEGAPEHVRDFVESVGEEMHRLGKLVESFLTLTRVRDGKGIARIMRCGVNDLVMDSAEHCTPMARQHRVILSPGLLATEETMDASIAGEPELLRTMLDNLVRNAIRFSPADDRVEIRASVADGHAAIVVRDFGPGIPESHLATIFDRFAQAGDEQRKGRGHGLGLAIAQGIAELHGGRISVENCVDRGCEFEIVLPLYAG